MIRSKALRNILGFLLGGMAGLSFCLSILPVALALVDEGAQDFFGLALSRYAVYTALVWAAGGWSVARAGFLKAGMIIMGIVGALSGGLLVGLALSAPSSLLAAGLLSGVFYGVVGGMILGRILSPIEEEQELS